MTRTLLRNTATVVLLGGMLLGAPARGAAQGGGKGGKAASAAKPAYDAGKSRRDAAPAAMTAKTALPYYDRATIQGQWGIEVESLHLTAGGYMLDFRYKVVDAAKAASLFDRRIKPLLKDEATGAVMAVPVPPKTGALRSVNDPKEGRTYSMFFANPGQFIKKFRKVTVTVGEFSVSGLTVR